jgi:hypothetical protein
MQRCGHNPVEERTQRAYDGSETELTPHPENDSP